jgi:hypothetical protein
MANKGDRFCQKGTALLNQWRQLQVPFSGQGTDEKLVSFLFDVIQPLDLVDIYKDLRPAEPEVHDGHQALTAGQDLGFIFVLHQKPDGLFHCVWGEIFKGTRFHIRSPVLL